MLSFFLEKLKKKLGINFYCSTNCNFALNKTPKYSIDLNYQMVTKIVEVKSIKLLKIMGRFLIVIF